MQKTFVSVKLSSLVPPHMCCRRQCSVQRAGRKEYKLQNCSRHFRMLSSLKDLQCIAVRIDEDFCEISNRPNYNPLVANARNGVGLRHVECLNKNTKPQNNGSHCTSRSTLFHTGNKAKKRVCLSCTMHCVVSLLFQLCRLGNGSGKRKINSHPFTFKLLSISIGVNSHVLNSPQTFQNHLKNSKNILLVHEVVVKRHAASRKRKCSLAEKLVSVCC